MPLLGLLKRIGESSFWRRTGAVHAWLYARSGGWLGHDFLVVRNLLLTTTGRRSGEPRTVPLTYMPDGDTWVVVASNGGSDRHPAWWLNLRADPRARIQVGGRMISVVASEADPATRARLWPRLKQMNPFYRWYERISGREIPVVILRPAVR
jgi:deazaflavin-dependent oxidoreductase (nitroreductase family)